METQPKHYSNKGRATRKEQKFKSCLSPILYDKSNFTYSDQGRYRPVSYLLQLGKPVPDILSSFRCSWKSYFCLHRTKSYQKFPTKSFRAETPTHNEKVVKVSCMENSQETF